MDQLFDGLPDRSGAEAGSTVRWFDCLMVRLFNGSIVQWLLVDEG
jgi:hypothetical protein